VGTDLILSLDSTILGAQSDASLTLSQTLAEQIIKNDNGYVRNLSGRQGFEVSADSFALNTDEDTFLSNIVSTLEIEDSSQTFVEMPRLTSIELTLEQAMAELGTLDDNLWRKVAPVERSSSLSVDFIHYVPDGTTVLDDILGWKNTGERRNARLTVDGFVMEASVAFGDMEIDASTSEFATVSLDLAVDGPATSLTSGLAPSVNPIIDAWEAQTLFDLLLDIQSSNFAYQGNAYMSSMTLTASDDEAVSISSEFMGDGELTVLDQTP